MLKERSGLPALLEAARRRWKLCLLVALPLALAVGAYAEVTPPQYDAQTTVAFSPRPNSSIGADVLRVVLPRYVALLKAQATVDSVSRSTGVPTAIVGAANVSIATDSANLLIVVRDTSPQQAATAANALAATALDAARQDTLLQALQVAPALPPHQPSAPARTLLILAGLFAGLVAGITVAVLVERGRPRIRDPREAAQAAGLDALGQLPRRRGAELGWPVRAILARSERAGAPVIGITSPSGVHGRTTLALAYAVAAARQNQRVVLVDADLRRRRLTESLASARPTGGLPQLLPSEAGLDEWLVPGPVEGVLLLPAPSDEGAVDAFASRLPRLLRALAERADRVVLDCPPVEDDDGQALLVHVPAALVVVRSGAHASDVAAAADVLRDLGPRPLGVVLNRGAGTARVQRWYRRGRSRRRAEQLGQPSASPLPAVGSTSREPA